jgi:hypothetical protein
MSTNPFYILNSDNEDSSSEDEINENISEINENISEINENKYIVLKNENEMNDLNNSNITRENNIFTKNNNFDLYKNIFISDNLLDKKNDINDINNIITKYKEVNNNNNNKKKILCYNILNKGSCSYGNKCVYAHSIEEQNINNNLLDAYNIIKNNFSLENIDIINNKKLFNALLHITKLCNLCIKGICPGGLNCKFGTCSKKYQVCKCDLLNGNCPNKKSYCKLIHLTDRGLIPYNIQKNRYYKNNNDSINNNYFLNKKLLTKESIKTIKYTNNIDKYSMSDDDSSIDTDTDTYTYNETINHLYHESIFKC